MFYRGCVFWEVCFLFSPLGGLVESLLIFLSDTLVGDRLLRTTCVCSGECFVFWWVSVVDGPCVWRCFVGVMLWEAGRGERCPRSTLSTEKTRSFRDKVRHGDDTVSTCYCGNNKQQWQPRFRSHRTLFEVFKNKNVYVQG
ncbi:unnamed protein product [Ectocarpus sp. 12 AP-2014]